MPIFLQTPPPPGFEADPESPYWLGLDYLGYGTVQPLSQDERQFWNFLIHKYLHPLHEDKAHKAKVFFCYTYFPLICYAFSSSGVCTRYSRHSPDW